MKQYGVRIRRKNSRGEDKILDVFHLPLSYMDWAVYSSSEELFDPATVRYLFDRYVIRVIEEGIDLTVRDLLESDASVIETVVSNIIKKSTFQDPNSFPALVKSLESVSKTLAGCYDLFIFQQLGPDFYLRMLDSDAYTRAQVIMMLEKSTGISVKERFDEAITKKIPLDLLSSPDQYKRDMRKHGMSRPNMRPQRKPPLDEFKNSSRDLNIPPASKDKMPSNIDSMLSEAKSSLAEALNAGRKKAKNKKSTFDWTQDEASFNQFESE
jgi:hypothetical protein